MGEEEEEEEERRGGGVFDPGIHLAFMVWRRLSSPLNFVFRWREPERWEGDCGAGVRSHSPPPPHLGGTCVGAERGEGGSVQCREISKCPLMPRKNKVLQGWTLALS